VIVLRLRKTCMDPPGKSRNKIFWRTSTKGRISNVYPALLKL
jgi:hypothetical protein